MRINIGNKAYSRIKDKLMYLGINNMSPNIFIYLRVVCFLVLLLFTFLFLDNGVVLGIVISVIYYIVFEYLVLDLKIKKRIIRLERDALEIVPVINFALNNGASLKKAFIIAINSFDNDLSLEFKKVIREVEIGKSLEESLELMKSRLPSDILKDIVINYIDFKRIKNKAIDNINECLVLVNDKLIKSYANDLRKVPFKIAVISILYVMLVLFILILLSLFI